MNGLFIGTVKEHLASISGSQSSSETTRDASPVSARSSHSATFLPISQLPKPNKSQEDVRSSVNMLQEPDVIASAKNSINTQNESNDQELMKAPKAPPRKRKKNKPPSPTPVSVFQ